ncbi:MAG: AraC family transcriptional regulator [Victivallaceae bacterium]|nr:AraC family transcriptional regulator [Victivallaceae bacterium]
MDNHIPLRIHCRCFAEKVHPWIQNRLFTPYWRFYWNPTRGGFLRCDGEEMELDRDHFAVIAGYTRFDTFARAPFEQFYIHFNPDDKLPAPARKITLFPADPVLIARIGRFREAFSRPDAAIECDLLAHAILCEALLQMPGFSLRIPKQPDARIEKALRYLEIHLSDAPGNLEIAAAIGMNRNHFIRLFTAEMKESPQLYSRRKRVERACELLHFSDRSIDQIAEATGFRDRYYFTRVFSAMLRIPPGTFRKLRAHSNGELAP